VKNWFRFDLAKQGLLGINARNLDYIIKYNPRRFYPEMDDKTYTKELAHTVGIPCPALYGVIEHQQQASTLEEITHSSSSFVIKPAHGSGGSGIIVIVGKNEHGFLKTNGTAVSKEDLIYHINNILSGLYSLGGHPDKAIIEEHIQCSDVFSDISFQGLPDIRMITLHGVPVMSMLRLPTKLSNGKANVHSGGIGVGVSVATGKTTYGMQHNQYIETHPDTGTSISGIQIPVWQDILKLAPLFNSAIHLSYIGMDIVLDKRNRPLLLEANARPGIAIQIANRAGLRSRLELVEKNIHKLKTAEHKIHFAMEHFL
jgi:alpha-L-glutamate ligase-like protein